MCSVVGYVGTQPSKKIILDGLKRLEYRGYDSAGFACLDDECHLKFVKSEGELSRLTELCKKDLLDGAVGIGHTRWATHGKATTKNAHPHFDCKKSVSVVHNGIIENFSELKTELEDKGHSFQSATDTEVIAHLFESYISVSNDPKKLLHSVVSRLKGAYAFIVLVKDHPDFVFVARSGSPLCIGIGDNEKFIASDMLAFAGRTDKVVFLPEGSHALLSKTSMELFDANNNVLEYKLETLSAEWVNAEKDGHEHFMLKEIYEQKLAIARTVEWYEGIRKHVWKHLGVDQKCVKTLKKVTLLGCGTSWHAGRIAEFFFESIAGVSCTSALASEFRHREFYPDKKGMFIAVSQSGETADTLEALRFINGRGLTTVALTNVASSTIVRESDGFFLTHAGPEVAVASTKAFSTQVAALYWIAHRIALEKGIITLKKLKQKENEVVAVGQILEDAIEKYKHKIIHEYADYYAQFEKFIFLGRHIGYPFALEAALKLKEISYVFCQAYPAGELKHGPIALVDESTPVFLFSHADSVLYKKLLSSAQEVKARGGHIVAFLFDGQDELAALADTVFEFPMIDPLLAPLAMTGLMQFFAYQIAKKRGCPIDKPRNLAKSVTVE